MIQKIKNIFKKIENNSDGYHTFNDLYEHRCAIFIALLNTKKENCWKSKLNSDGSKWGQGFVSGIEDKITYHLPLKYWDKLKIKEIPIGKWDGHSSEDVIKRLLKL